MKLLSWFSAPKKKLEDWELLIRANEREQCVKLFKKECTYTGLLVSAIIKSRAKCGTVSAQEGTSHEQTRT